MNRVVPVLMRQGLHFRISLLYLGYADVWDAVESLHGILGTRAGDRDEFKTRNSGA